MINLTNKKSIENTESTEEEEAEEASEKVVVTSKEVVIVVEATMAKTEVDMVRTEVAMARTEAAMARTEEEVVANIEAAAEVITNKIMDIKTMEDSVIMISHTNVEEGTKIEIEKKTTTLTTIRTTKPLP